MNMKKLSIILIAVLIVNVLTAVTFANEQPEENIITNSEILGVWEFDAYASQKAAKSEADKKLIRDFDKLRFYFQQDGTVEMAGGEVANFTQVSANKFEITVDETTLIFTLADDKLYAEIPVSTTKTIYPVFIRNNNN